MWGNCEKDGQHKSCWVLCNVYVGVKGLPLKEIASQPCEMGRELSKIAYPCPYLDLARLRYCTLILTMLILLFCFGEGGSNMVIAPNDRQSSPWSGRSIVALWWAGRIAHSDSTKWSPRLTLIWPAHTAVLWWGGRIVRRDRGWVVVWWSLAGSVAAVSCIVE